MNLKDSGVFWDDKSKNSGKNKIKKKNRPKSQNTTITQLPENDTLIAKAKLFSDHAYLEEIEEI